MRSIVGTLLIGTSLTMDLGLRRRNGSTPVPLYSWVCKIIDDSTFCQNALSIRGQCRASALVRRCEHTTRVTISNSIFRRLAGDVPIEINLRLASFVGWTRPGTMSHFVIVRFTSSHTLQPKPLYPGRLTRSSGNLSRNDGVHQPPVRVSQRLY